MGFRIEREEAQDRIGAQVLHAFASVISGIGWVFGYRAEAEPVEHLAPKELTEISPISP